MNRGPKSHHRRRGRRCCCHSLAAACQESSTHPQRLVRYPPACLVWSVKCLPAVVNTEPSLNGIPYLVYHIPKVCLVLEIFGTRLYLRLRKEFYIIKLVVALLRVRLHVPSMPQSLSVFESGTFDLFLTSCVNSTVGLH